MTLWLDAQLSPDLAAWLSSEFDVAAVAVRDLGLRDAEDLEIFEAARKIGAAIMSKDRDFVDLVMQHGPPPKIIWITCGNTSNERMREVLQHSFPHALDLLRHGEPLVEISDSKTPTPPEEIVGAGPKRFSDEY